MAKASARLFVSGKVQGVFFRSGLKKIAESLGLLGWVRNLEDGRVEIFAEGEKENLEKMIAWANRGPFFARVEKVEVEWSGYRGEFQKFEIRGQKG